jgi:hypothetical protein
MIADDEAVAEAIGVWTIVVIGNVPVVPFSANGILVAKDIEI